MSRGLADRPDEGHERADTPLRPVIREGAGSPVRQELARRLAELPGSHPSSPGYAARDHAAEPGSGSGRGSRADQPGGGWDAPGVAGHPDRPDPESLRISPARAAHILDGDATGGGHRHGTGRPGKTEFPAGWDDARITGSVLDVARYPRNVHQQWNGRWKGAGERDGVDITVIVTPDGTIWTAWPEPGGRDVVTNRREDSE